MPPEGGSLALIAAARLPAARATPPAPSCGSTPTRRCSWRGKPMHGAELVRRPDADDHQKSKAGKVNGAPASKPGLTADKEHHQVQPPHGKREQHLRVFEVGWADAFLGDQRSG